MRVLFESYLKNSEIHELKEKIDKRGDRIYSIHLNAKRDNLLVCHS